MSRNIPNASEMGKVGGKSIALQRGSEYMAEIGAKGNEAMKAMGKDFLRQRALKAAESRKRNRLKKLSSVDIVANMLQGK